VFFGVSCGSIFSANIVGKVSWKTILLTSLLGNGIGLFFYSCFSNYYLLGFGRWLSGFNQVFLLIYIPLYIDAFADRQSKSMWMSAALLCSPIGTMIGFGITAIMINKYESWRLAFQIFALIMAVGFVLFAPIPKRFFDVKKINDIKSKQRSA
jgi:MFS family permease